MKMKFVIFLACIVISVSSKPFLENKGEFEIFKHKFGKTYKNAIEELHRLKIFSGNLETISDHNKLFKKGQVSFDLAINQFADLTREEMADLHNDLRLPAHYQPRISYKEPTGAVVPDSIDWRDYGYVTEVKDQGNQCGSSWAYGATGSLEGQNFAKTGTLVSLSEQNLIDCSTKWGNYGCNGGWMDSAYQYVIDNGGIDTEESYPYIGMDGTCHYEESTKGGTANGYIDVPSGDEDALKQATGSFGPVAVAVDATQSTFSLYSGGIYYEPLCSPDNVGHGALVAGYGSDSGEDYWLVKNCWGPLWGEEGYIRMARNKKNNCGIATIASYPTV